jgi:hypothetical protein
MARRIHQFVQHTQDQDIGAAMGMLGLDAIEQYMRGRAAPLPGALDVEGADIWAKFVAGPRTGPFGRFRDKAHSRVDQRGIPSPLTWSEAPHRFPQNAVDIAVGRIAKPV